MNMAELNRKEGARSRVGVITHRASLGFHFTSDGTDFYCSWKAMDRHIEAGELAYVRPMHEGTQFTFTFKPEI